METKTIYLIFTIIVALTIIATWGFSYRYFKKQTNYVLVQGKGKNTDSNLTEAVLRLKVTNKWEPERSMVKTSMSCKNKQN